MIIAEPTARAKEIVKGMENPENWKLPLSDFYSEDFQLIAEVKYAVDFYHGGSEVHNHLGKDGWVKRISSEGYYHYIGA